MARSVVVDAIERWARSASKRLALVDGHRSVTFGQLRGEIAACAALVRACDVGGRQAIGLFLPNCATFVVALLGIAATERAAILFPPTLTAEELLHYCREAGTRIVLTDPAHRSVVTAATGRAVGHGLDGLEAFWVDVAPRPPLEPGDFIGQLTSGADRPPKVAIRTHAAVWNEIEDFGDEIGLAARDTMLVLPSIAHSYGLIGGTLAPLCRGARVILRDRFIRDEVLEIARRDRPTILYAVPVMYRALVAAPVQRAGAMATLRLCFSAGAPLPRDVDETFAQRYGQRIAQNFGTTEAGVITIRLEWTPRLAGSVGRPVRHRAAIIADPDGRPLSPGSVGAVKVQSRALARGYLRGKQGVDPSLKDGWFSTGDLGWMSEDGYLFLTGRASQVVQIGDSMVDLTEVEGLIGALPGVREAAVVGMDQLTQGARLKAVVVAHGLVAADIIEHCRRQLPGIPVPEIVEFREALPRTTAGKILRRGLRDS